MRKIKFANGKFYHIYNRGVDKRNIFKDAHDIQRFLQSMDEFNTIIPIGSLYESSFLAPEIKNKRRRKKLVNFISYCLNLNHYHFILEQLVENGVSQFMHRLSGGYSWQFNNKYERSGSLFQGTFKAKLIDSNDYLLHLSAYVNLNYRVHQLGGLAAKLIKSSWEEYTINSKMAICKKKIILDQFSSAKEYKTFALEALPSMIERKEKDKDFADLLLES